MRRETRDGNFCMKKGPSFSLNCFKNISMHRQCLLCVHCWSVISLKEVNVHLRPLKCLGYSNGKVRLMKADSFLAPDEPGEYHHVRLGDFLLNKLCPSKKMLLWLGDPDYG